MSPSMTRFGRLFLVAVSPALGSCAEATAPTSAPDLEGVVASVTIEGNTVQLVVESITVPATGYARIALQVRGPGVGAAVYVQEADGLQSRDATVAFSVGARIQG